MQANRSTTRIRANLWISMVLFLVTLKPLTCKFIILWRSWSRMRRRDSWAPPQMVLTKVTLLTKVVLKCTARISSSTQRIIQIRVLIKWIPSSLVTNCNHCMRETNSLMELSLRSNRRVSSSDAPSKCSNKWLAELSRRIISERYGITGAGIKRCISQLPPNRASTPNKKPWNSTNKSRNKTVSTKPSQLLLYLTSNK